MLLLLELAVPQCPKNSKYITLGGGLRVWVWLGVWDKFVQSLV